MKDDAIFERNNIAVEADRVFPYGTCLPPTSVGGYWAGTSFIEPASAGLLERSRSPAEAGWSVLVGSQTTD